MAQASREREGDQQLQESIFRQLLNETLPQVEGLRVHYRKGVVTLKGVVGNLDKKRRVEEAVLSIPGVDQVHNELRLGSREREGIGEQFRPERSGNPVDRSGEENPFVHGDEARRWERDTESPPRKRTH